MVTTKQGRRLEDPLTRDELIQHNIATGELVYELGWRLGEGGIFVGVATILEREGGREEGREAEKEERRVGG